MSFPIDLKGNFFSAATWSLSWLGHMRPDGEKLRVATELFSFIKKSQLLYSSVMIMCQL
jgi:hypothetical protein